MDESRSFMNDERGMDQNERTNEKGYKETMMGWDGDAADVVVAVCTFSG